MQSFKTFNPKKTRWELYYDGDYITTSRKERQMKYLKLELRQELETSPKIQEAISDIILREMQRKLQNYTFDILYLLTEDKNKIQTIHMLVEHDAELSNGDIEDEIKRIDFIIPTMLHSHHRIPTADNLRPIFQPTEITVQNLEGTEQSRQAVETLLETIKGDDLTYLYVYKQHYFRLVEPKPNKPDSPNQLNVKNELLSKLKIIERG